MYISHKKISPYPAACIVCSHLPFRKCIKPARTALQRPCLRDARFILNLLFILIITFKKGDRKLASTEGGRRKVEPTRTLFDPGNGFDKRTDRRGGALTPLRRTHLLFFSFLFLTFLLYRFLQDKKNAVRLSRAVPALFQSTDLADIHTPCNITRWRRTDRL